MTIVPHMLRAAGFAGLLALSVGATDVASAQDASSRVQATITSQMDAFMADDAATAFGFAAPGLQRIFGNPDRFMSMVRSGYEAVYRPANVRFGRFAAREGQLFQEVSLTGPKGKEWLALYTLSEQEDGTLRITGCRLIEAPGQGV